MATTKNIPYEKWQEPKCEPVVRNNYRYMLSAKVTEKTENKKTLVVVGINPSTADDKNKDATICRVETLAEDNDYDGFIMVNVYPQRATDANNLPKNGYEEQEQIKKNIDEIYKCVSQPFCQDVLLAFGAHIEDRKYLGICLKEIIKHLEKLKPHYKYIAKTKDKHPCHPLYPYFCKYYPPQKYKSSYKILDYNESELEGYLEQL